MVGKAIDVDVTSRGAVGHGKVNAGKSNARGDGAELGSSTFLHLFSIHAVQGWRDAQHAR